eukprot:Seg3010.2 transcript_id=Seg3010.2/GoldUCD/mRNA.D3Y31 product="Acid-sensing ion channel 4-B" protein_id=Seg3010.2/GoldUCD/D3Y31
MSAAVTIKYFKYQVYIKVDIQTKDNMTLPAMTFCNTNLYSPTLYEHKTAPVSQAFPLNCSYKNMTYFKTELNHHWFAYACKVFLGKYTGNSTTMSVNMPSYFKFPTHWSITPHIYPCFTLNRESKLVQVTEGENGGLHMMLYLPEEIPEMFQYPTPEILIDKRQGMFVTIHDPKQGYPGDEGILLSPGYHTHIKIKKKIIRRIQSPYPSHCRREDEPRKESIFPGRNTLETCFESCFHVDLYEKCQTTFTEMRAFMPAEKYPGLANYSDPNFWKCLKKVMSELNHAKCDCRYPCEQEVYETKTNRNPWPQAFQASSLLPIIRASSRRAKPNYSVDEIRATMIKLSISYENNAETIQEEKELYTLSSIVSDLGGQMGLFLGASLLSLAEILALILTHAWRKLSVRNEVKAFTN